MKFKYRKDGYHFSFEISPYTIFLPNENSDIEGLAIHQVQAFYRNLYNLGKNEYSKNKKEIKKIVKNLKVKEKDHFVDNIEPQYPRTITEGEILTLLNDTEAQVKSFENANQILFIENPENNLHIATRRRLSRIFVRLVNRGNSIVLKTHCDVIVRELNSSIILYKAMETDPNLANELAKRYNFREDEIISAHKISAYTHSIKGKSKIKIIEDDGICAKVFDKEIAHINNSNNDIYYSLQEIL